MERVKVSVFATDPISRAGVASALRMSPQLDVLPSAATEPVQVVVAVVDNARDGVIEALRQVQRSAPTRVVLVVADVNAADLAAATECGVIAVVRRSEATSERLVQAITAAARGEGSVPADLLGSLMEQVGRVQRHVLGPRGFGISGLANREVAVLKLIAEGHDTAEIARTLSYSERTVKNVLHNAMIRLQVRNRSHAVAYAVREGLI
ncbi:response regulator transcription factor [Actinocrinis sp.]|jgi:DNA-binding NarL/FixJ family response regulator|uniref:response regulator transcription factor n=1 Tax=Actinocrinis sp. TaxID=1920516 RepID=UPI0032C231F1